MTDIVSMKKMQEYAVYVHIPFCKARCGYCAFSSCCDFSLCDRYFETLCAEIAAADVPQNACITTMFWGGGTPSSVSVVYLRRLYEALSAKFDLAMLREFTVECNPESTTDELLTALLQIGVNRISFGLQSTNDVTLKKIGRLHSYGGFLHALELARAHGFENINADLIVGLPEDCDDFLHTVRQTAALELSHISLYALEIHENTAFQKLCAQYDYTDDQLADMYDSARQILQEAGYCRYEVSNFAKPGKECLHNLMYWTENRYFGFGAAASGFVENVRYGNAFDIQDYIAGVERAYCDEISPAEEICEYVMLGLRLERGIDVVEFSSRFGTNFYDCFPAATALIDKGFLCCKATRIFVPDDKFYVLNSILVELLPD